MNTEDLKHIALSYAEENMNDAIYPAHRFKAILHKDMGLIPFIEKELNEDYYYLLDWADIQISLLPRTVKKSRDLAFTDEALAVFDEAENFKDKIGLDQVNAQCILMALVTPGVGFTFDQLKTLPLTPVAILDKTGGTTATPNVAANIISPSAPSTASKDNIGKYCIDKIAEIQAGKIAPVVGFEKEIGIIYEVLGCKTKANLLITGEAGVGKTSLLNGFILQVASGRVPHFLQGIAIYQVDIPSLTADASYKGEVEDRFKKLINEVEAQTNAILIIESLDKLFDKQGMLAGTASMLKDEIQKGRLSMLATSTVDGFTKNIETDKEMLATLEKITVDEPTFDQSLRILKGAIDQYETYHELKVNEEVLDESIKLAKRYLTEKSLPDSAFDLIDRTMSQIKTMNDMSQGTIEQLQAELTEIEGKQGDNDKDPELMQELTWLHYELMNKVNCILLSVLDSDVDFAKIGTIRERIDYMKDALAKIAEASQDKREEVKSSDLFAVVAKMTGIPLGKVQTKERDRLLGAEETLKKRVIGQDHAVKKVLDSVFESRSGLNKKGQPMGSFFFLGPTGTGKTELSKALAEFLFGDESALIRFDMSEFKEEHSVALLYGAPPGYVGYEEGGLLVNKIRQKPYSVVLFDEIEKAHKSVFDLFLQILDEGKLHDRLGREGDFSNAIILFTSNIGSQFVVDSFNKGVVPQNNDLMDIMQQYFRPEFLGRLTEIVPFSPITEETVTKIFGIHLNGLLKLLKEQNITLKMSDDTRKAIAMKGFNPQYGARPIIGIIRKELRNPLSKLIIAGKVKSGDEVEVYVENGETKFKV